MKNADAAVAAYLKKYKDNIALTFDHDDYDKLVQFVALAGKDFNLSKMVSCLKVRQRHEQEEKVAFILSGKSTKKHQFMDAVSNDPLAQVIMDGFIHQMKRKMAGLRVDNHIAVVLFGATGGGKSRFVETLLDTLDDWMSIRDVKGTDFGDEKKKEAMAGVYVQFWDEMEKANKADIEAVKSWITATMISWRVFHTTALAKRPQRGSLIGCSNKDIRDLIKDETGMRRFYQINCLDILNWTKINSIDWLDYIQSIDHTKQSPIVPYLKEMKAHQKELTADPIGDWLSGGLDIIPFSTGEYKLGELHKSFVQFSKTAITNKSLAKKLRDRGGISRHTENGLVFDLRQSLTIAQNEGAGSSAPLTDAKFASSSGTRSANFLLLRQGADDPDDLLSFFKEEKERGHNSKVDQGSGSSGEVFGVRISDPKTRPLIPDLSVPAAGSAAMVCGGCGEDLTKSGVCDNYSECGRAGVLNIN